jgi:hypothetical protein
MASKIVLKKSSVASKIPLVTDLDYGEVALNYQDGKLYFKKADNTIDAFSTKNPVHMAETAQNDPAAGDFWWNSQEGSLKIYYYDGSNYHWVDAVSSPVLTTGTSAVVESPFSRADLSISSSVLVAGTSENLTIAAYKSYVLMSITTSAAAWVRIYSDAVSRDADISRNIGTDPVAGTGIIAEIITTSNMQQKITPFVYGGNLDTPANNNMYIRVTNLSGSATSINISVKLTRLEI